ncbi:MAG: pyridoxamine 5'-phosphate oxidase, partial [Rhodanobacteraceae bacterium]
ARASGDREPNAMTLATADAHGRVSARIVLFKGADAGGFRFFTNYESAKGDQLAAHPQAALCFHWKLLREQVQVRIEGSVEKVSAVESDEYFASRPRGSQIGAWASFQSQPLDTRQTFERRYDDFDRRYAAEPVPRPPNWGGYRLRPDRIEFWYGATYRLHERVCYAIRDGIWSKGLLYP